jgi:hypothetical protein
MIIKAFTLSMFSYPQEAEYIRVTEAQRDAIMANEPGNTPQDLQVLDVDDDTAAAHRIISLRQSRYFSDCGILPDYLQGVK